MCGGFGAKGAARALMARTRTHRDGTDPDAPRPCPPHGADTALRWNGGRVRSRGDQYLGRRNHSVLARLAQNTITRIDTTQMTRPSR
ncbi:hypothetical protein GCM10019016_068330 [Streptomyces prasinosporus]|uniref:Transposase n=1 Tax=Streptomyces prasinosporus TaxID=68256 RepID=A0ABP6TZ23_9ACTN|nr:hypothetical protein GCM10010332_53680 [Streptomyces albogriseolus]